MITPPTQKRGHFDPRELWPWLQTCCTTLHPSKTTAATLVIAVTLGCTVLTAVPHNEAADSRFSAIQRLIWSFYPELRSRGLVISFRAPGVKLDGDVVHQLLVARIDQAAEDVLTDRPPILSAIVTFDLKGRVTSFVTTDCTFVKREASGTFADRADAHPEWSSQDLAREIATAGGTFGPDREHDLRARILSQLPALEPLIGKAVLTKLFPPSPAEADQLLGMTSSSSVYWLAAIRTQRGEYDITYDVFEGRVVTLRWMGTR